MVDSASDILPYFTKRIQAAKEQQLKELDLRVPWNTHENDKLRRIPEAVFELTQLEKLDLGFNSLTEVPEAITKLSNLTQLDLRNNSLTEVPETITNLSNLTQLDLSANSLTEVPEAITNLSNLTQLDLGFNSLTEVPEAITKLSNLTQLDLRNNSLTEVPETITKLSNLTHLNLSANSLKEVPEAITRLSNLTYLDLNDNSLTEVPEAITKLSNLTYLDLNDNSLTEVPKTITKLSNLTYLGLSNNSLTEVPKTITKLSNLTQLDLNDNSLTEVPEAITKLSNLTQLDLSANSLTEIPETITKLSNLTHLGLRNNSLTEVPEAITNLSKLTQLDLGFNSLTEIPEAITKLSNLTHLGLRNNSLTEVPETITKLSKLTQLDLGFNSLTEIPETITNLSKLTQLDLGFNSLTEVPKTITRLSNLIILQLDGNEIEKPSLEIVNQGIKSIRNYFLQLEEAGKDYIYEAKLIIVGEGGAGKTTLAKKIDDPDYELLKDEATTEGIDVITWTFPLPDKQRDFQVNIWDFGGQEIYHATHQFFLTKRSLYALVADSRKDDTDFYYWLNAVELLSDNSPILIVKNEKQDRHKEININALRGQFTNLKETLATNLETNRGLPEIITNIQDYIKKLPHIGQVLPKTWVKVRQALEQDSRNYISLQEYLDICAANGFTKHSDKLQLSSYLHDLGVCLHFQDKEDSILYKTVILKPTWGTDAVYTVLDNKQVTKNQGCFTRDDLKDIWHESEYAEMRGELLELMSKFQLCYEIPSCPDTFISPQLLSENQPVYNWDKSHNLILRYSYPDFMPKGIISRFMVAMHEYIEQQAYVWKSGIRLIQDQTKAEVIEDYGKREIRVRVVGNNKRNLMTIITHELDKINNSFSNRLKYQKLIPCNCEKCESNDNKHFHNFEILENFIRDRQREIQCQQSYKMVDVLSLIDDVIIWNKNDRQSKDQQDLKYQHQSLVSVTIENPKQQQGNHNNNMSNITQSHSGSGDNVGGNKTVTNDQSRNLNISDNAQITTSGSGAFSLGDINGTVANTINQLPNFADEPDKKELKTLLSQLQTAVMEAELDDEETEETLEQIKAIAESLENPQDGTVKKTAKRAMKLLRGTAAALPPSAAMVTICNQLPDLIGKIF